MQTIEQWEAEAMRLVEDYAGARAETAVFNVTQQSGMTVRMAKPRLKALSAHLASHPGRQGGDGKDAQRYRWLRSRVGVDYSMGRYAPFLGVANNKPTAEATDAAIDAAMALPKEPTHD